MDVAPFSLRFLLSDAFALTWRGDGLKWRACARDEKSLRS
ncbi:hypothetical protein GCWU000325_02633 [Alloprevotella tannerae ATCC 51259]|uniref:Uncharacterized protein n=1 Tax=Alloprevotella tannerae ATCC 51259 TaxID=626522 RepID=C9LK68_9BACT|nr:hypothetical protein GCWU000325_02633 [Alloprevotella tannerae ATCC 51259]